MDVFIGKQPILNKYEQVVAYELLYRNKNLNSFPDVDQDEATLDVIINAFFTFGIDKLTDNKPCYINFSEKLIMHDFIFQLDPKNIVIEILENFTITEAFVNRITELKQFGFKIALDDYVHSDLITPLHYKLFNQVDIIKLDFLHCERTKINAIVSFFNRFYPSITLLAEKVETREEYTYGIENGFELFQGYFFDQPKIVMSKDLEPNTISCFELMGILNSEDPDIDEIAETIERDISLSYKLLRLVNTTTNAKIRSNITSIRQAIMMLGLLELQKWIYLLAIRGNESSNQNDEIISISLFRSKICEMLARQKGFKNYSEFYLAGMFSNIDAILHQPLESIVADLPFSTVVIDTIMKKDTDMAPYLQLAISLQKLDWDTIVTLATALQFELESIETLYHTTSEWVSSILNADIDSVLNV